MPASGCIDRGERYEEEAVRKGEKKSQMVKEASPIFFSNFPVASQYPTAVLSAISFLAAKQLPVVLFSGKFQPNLPHYKYFLLAIFAVLYSYWSLNS